MIYKFNEDFFKIWSPEMAWVLGILSADGNVFKNRLTLCLHEKDRDVVENVKLLMDSETPIHPYISKTSYVNNLNIPSCNMLKFSLSRKSLVDDLSKLGVVPRKSLILKWNNNIPKEYLSHFVRGYFEGDGWLTGFNQNSLKLSIMGTLDFISGLADNTKEFYPSILECTKKGQKNKVYRVAYNHKNASKIAEWLYKDSNPKIRMERKYQLYLKSKEVTYRKTHSEFIGVTLKKGKWISKASWSQNGILHYKFLGYFDSEVLAAQARNKYILDNNIPSKINYGC
jgi:hypothetical protein